MSTHQEMEDTITPLPLREATPLPLRGAGIENPGPTVNVVAPGRETTGTPDTSTAAGSMVVPGGVRVDQAPGTAPPPVIDPPVPDRPKIVKWVKEKRPRHKKGEEKAAPGRLSWVWGTKLAFFSKRKDQWLREAEAGRAGAFYTKMMKLYLKKYGYQLADDEDFEVDIEDPPDSAADEVIHERVTEENAFREKYQKTLRGRIGQWYRLAYGSLLKSDKTAFTELFTGVLDGAPAKPMRGQLTHFYSRKFYNTRVKPRADARIMALKRRAELEGSPAPKVIDIISKVTKEVWEEETLEFQKECEVALEREYAESLEAWEQSMADSPTRTPDEIAATLDNAAYYLQPFVDAIQQRFGMCATVLLCGPVGKRGGRVMMQSVHAGKTKGLAPQNWPEFDWLGFQEVERIMCNFGRECFSDVECRARVVGGSTEDEAGPSGRSRSSAQPPPARGEASTGGRAVRASGNEGAGGGGGNSDDAAEPTMGARAPEGEGSSQNRDIEMEGGEGGEEGDGAGDGNSDTEGVRPDDDVYGPDVDAETREEIEAWWQRGDRGEWTEELGKVHAAFERGKALGIEWGECVSKFFDFEGAWGFEEGSCQMARAKRPAEVGMWLQRGRKWYLPPSISLVGTRDDHESFAGRWWTWPESADWSGMAAMHGTNGLLQVMGALSWWGDKKRDGPEWGEWIAAVEDITWVLDELMDSGEIGLAPKAGTKRKRARAGASGDGDGDGANDRGKRSRRNAKNDESEEGARGDG
ncbi:hypothetical protein C8F04DRAFT_1309654 [Mycena alexandri]|uniref:Uncharacterized protein n=1 Tax=Mycena alexandri TaxID=1745969 RepID=A0AAD6T7C6_9AGAR|nr:hypothetical protein C8F04DRAFT_1309654 [Mycena alexandri]